MFQLIRYKRRLRINNIPYRNIISDLWWRYSWIVWGEFLAWQLLSCGQCSAVLKKLEPYYSLCRQGTLESDLNSLLIFSGSHRVGNEKLHHSYWKPAFSPACSPSPLINFFPYVIAKQLLRWKHCTAQWIVR